MLDIVVIGKDRPFYLEKCISAIEATSRKYRLTIIDDGSSNLFDIKRNLSKAHQIILNGKNMGSTPSMNTGIHLAHMWQWFYKESIDDPLLFIEDDMVLKSGWQEKCWEYLNKWENEFKIGFISGFDAPEHSTTKEISYVGDTIKIKDIIRSSMMYARKKHWASIGLVPNLDKDGKERGFPSAGTGSKRDWYYLTDAINSNKAQGKNCLVICGLAEHIGENNSTWRKE